MCFLLIFHILKLGSEENILRTCFMTLKIFHFSFEIQFFKLQKWRTFYFLWLHQCVWKVPGHVLNLSGWCNYAAAAATPDPLTHCPRLGIKPMSPNCFSRIFNPPFHSGNCGRTFFLKYFLIFINSVFEFTLPERDLPKRMIINTHKYDQANVKVKNTHTVKLRNEVYK